MNQETIVPGDLVGFNVADASCTAIIVEGTPPPAPEATTFVTGKEAKQLQKIQRVRNLLKTRALYIVVCTSNGTARKPEPRAMVMHPTGKLLLTDARFLIKAAT